MEIPCRKYQDACQLKFMKEGKHTEYRKINEQKLEKSKKGHNI